MRSRLLNKEWLCVAEVLDDALEPKRGVWELFDEKAGNEFDVAEWGKNFDRLGDELELDDTRERSGRLSLLLDRVRSTEGARLPPRGLARESCLRGLWVLRLGEPGGDMITVSPRVSIPEPPLEGLA